MGLLVFKQRRKLGIAAFKSADFKPRSKWKAEEDALLGWMPDEDIALKTGRSLVAVHNHRMRKGTGRYEKAQGRLLPKGQLG